MRPLSQPDTNTDEVHCSLACDCKRRVSTLNSDTEHEVHCSLTCDCKRRVSTLNSDTERSSLFIDV
jgi:hypothetical protein